MAMTKRQKKRTLRRLKQMPTFKKDRNRYWVFESAFNELSKNKKTRKNKVWDDSVGHFRRARRS